MIRTIKYAMLQLLVVLSVSMAGLAIVAPGTYAQPAKDACETLKAVDSTVDCTNTSTRIEESSEFSRIIELVLNTLSILVGAISVIMIIIGGFRYVISGGDSAGTKGAKDTILYAVIGLVIVLFAQVIVRFVITNTQSTPPDEEEEETTYIVPYRHNA